MIPKRDYYKFPSYIKEFLRAVGGSIRTILSIFIFPRKVSKNRISTPQYSGGLHILKADSTGRIKCDACKICEEQCPSQCISIEGTKPRLQKFNISILECTFCGICEEVCPIDAIVLSQKEVSAGYAQQNWNYDQNILAYREDINPIS